MISSVELEDLKGRICSLDNMSFDEIKSFTKEYKKEIETKYELLEQREFFKKYIDAVYLNQVQMLDAYIKKLVIENETELRFVKRILKYHLNCMLDSFIHATVAVCHLKEE